MKKVKLQDCEDFISPPATRITIRDFIIRIYYLGHARAHDKNQEKMLQAHPKLGLARALHRRSNHTVHAIHAKRQA